MLQQDTPNSLSTVPDDVVSSTSPPPPTPPIEMIFTEANLIAIIVYVVLMVFSTVGNVSVLITILKRSTGRRLTRVNLMLFHLAIADLFVTFLMMPLEIAWSYTVSWEGGDALCRICSFFRIFGLYLSSFILICISVDRLFAVTSPLNSVGTADRRGRRMLLAAWVMSAVCSAPQSAVFHVETHPIFTNYTQCVTFNSFPYKGLETAYALFGNIWMYVMPLIVISYCYAAIFRELCKKSGSKQAEHHMRRSSSGNLCRAKTRTLQMTFVTVLVFFFCWTPYNIMSFWFCISRDSFQEVDHRIQKILYLFACTNSSFNPLVYGFFNFSRQNRNRTRINNNQPIRKPSSAIGRDSSSSVNSALTTRSRLGTWTTASSEMSVPAAAAAVVSKAAEAAAAAVGMPQRKQAQSTQASMAA